MKAWIVNEINLDRFPSVREVEGVPDPSPCLPLQPSFVVTETNAPVRYYQYWKESKLDALLLHFELCQNKAQTLERDAQILRHAAERSKLLFLEETVRRYD